MASRASLGMLMAAHGFPAACAHRKASGPVGTVGNNVLTSVTGVGSRRAHRRPARLSTLRFSGGDCMASHMLPKPTSQAMGLVEDSELASAAGTPVKAPSTTIVVGGGPTGLATAIMLARLGYQGIHVRSSRRIHSGLMLLIMVLERLSAPPPPDSKLWGNADRSYALGVNGRGQKALKELDAWDRVNACAADVNGAMDVKPDGTYSIRESSYKKYITKILQRDRLVACLLEEIQEKYSQQVTAQHDTECRSIEWLEPGGGAPALVRLACGPTGRPEEPGQVLEGEFLVGADGFRSTVPAAMEKAGNSKFTRTVFEDTNPRVYRTISFRTPPEWRHDMNLSSNSADKDVGVTLQALPTREGIMMGLLLFKPGNAVIEEIKTTEEAREFFAKQFPQFLPHIDSAELERFAERPVSKLPVFQSCGPMLHRGPNTVLVGDCIHTVKPYFGMGVNSAFEDVMALQRCIKEADHRLAEALEQYSKSHAPNAQSLVRMSRRFDTGGFVGFVLPLILDGIFSRFAPWLFGPNNIRLLQNNDLSFAEIAAKKRRDRVLQVAVIAGLLFCLARLAFLVFNSACRFVASQGTMA